jgi:hypothetical protein
LQSGLFGLALSRCSRGLLFLFYYFFFGAFCVQYKLDQASTAVDVHDKKTKFENKTKQAEQQASLMLAVPLVEAEWEKLRLKCMSSSYLSANNNNNNNNKPKKAKKQRPEMQVAAPIRPVSSQKKMEPRHQRRSRFFSGSATTIRPISLDMSDDDDDNTEEEEKKQYDDVNAIHAAAASVVVVPKIPKTKKPWNRFAFSSSDVNILSDDDMEIYGSIMSSSSSSLSSSSSSSSSSCVPTILSSSDVVGPVKYAPNHNNNNSKRPSPPPMLSVDMLAPLPRLPTPPPLERVVVVAPVSAPSKKRKYTIKKEQMPKQLTAEEIKSMMAQSIDNHPSIQGINNTLNSILGMLQQQQQEYQANAAASLL